MNKGPMDDSRDGVTAAANYLSITCIHYYAYTQEHYIIGCR